MKAQKQNLLVMRILMILPLIMMVFAGYYTYKIRHIRMPAYYAEGKTDDGKLKMMGMTPLREPITTRNALLEWAELAATSAYNYNALNMRSKIDMVVDEYFTEDGGLQFINELESVGQFKNVEEGQYIVSSVAQGKPVILKEGRFAGEYSWKVQVPISVLYQGLGSPKKASMLISMMIIKVPTTTADKGLAINWITAQKTI